MQDFQNAIDSQGESDIQNFIDTFITTPKEFATTTNELMRQLENAYRLFNQLMSTIPGSFMLITREGKVAAASPKMRSKFLQREDIKNMDYTELTFPFFTEGSKDQLISNMINQALTQGMNIEKVLIDNTTTTGKPVIIEMNLQIIRNEINAVSGVMVNMVEDVIRHNMLPGNLEKDQKLKKLGSLSAGLVHEIKNPMQSISSIIQLIQHKYSQDKYLMDYMDSAMTEVRRISVILSEFLTFSGNNQEFMCYTHINKICGDVLKILVGNCYMNEIELRTELSDNIPQMILDAGRMKQVIVNLVTNSVDAINTLRCTDDFEQTHPNHRGIITISTEYNYDQNECYVSVRDNGIGMTEETLQNISRPFYTTKKYGTGIGVAISKNIIKNHGGRLKITSEYGKGSTFTVILPELAGQMEGIVRKNDDTQPAGITVTSGSQYHPDDYQFISKI